MRRHDEQIICASRPGLSRPAGKLFASALILSWLTLAGSAFAHENEEQKLTPSVSAPGDRFGWAVAISDETIVAGAPGCDSLGLTDAGAAFVFVHNGAAFVEEAAIAASDPASGDRFGRAVGISGDVLVVAAPFADAVAPDSGAVYVFRRGPSGWLEEQKLVGSDLGTSSGFGRSVAISGDTIVVGATGGAGAEGAAYVFFYDGATWSEQAKLVASDGMPSNLFGISVSVSGNRAAVGASNADGVAPETGAAYVFARTGTSWSQEAKVLALDSHSNDFFGASVSIFDESVVAIGAPGADDLGSKSGVAYVFDRTGSAWMQHAKYRGDSAGDQFGNSVSYSYRSTLVGVAGDDEVSADAGAATIWVDLPTGVGYNIYVASDGAAADSLGNSVAAGTCDMVVGASGRDEVGTDSGAVYVFILAVPKVTVRNGTGVNPTCMTTTLPPVIGSSWEVQVDATAVPGAAFTRIDACAAPLASPRLTPWGEVLVNRASGVYFVSVVPGAGVNLHSMVVPDDPYLIGITMYQQARIQDAAFRILQLCNAEDVRIGCHLDVVGP